jgi:Trypsin-like peptidase domain
MYRQVWLGIVAVCIMGSAAGAAMPSDSVPHTAALSLPFFGTRQKAVYDSLPGDPTPHPAVARIIVPEDGSTAFGSGTLVGVHDDRGLVVTNWHVVRDAVGLVDVVFPDGFHSHAKPLKVDSDWDLAALVIWRPKVEPVKIATQPPRPGDLLTIHGYGRGKYRIAMGHCTTYYAPKVDYPHEMVELDAEARQGDSGGPIFNQAGELAGVLFGAGQGTTLGSFAPRVRYFLASVAPDIDQTNSKAIAAADRPAPNLTMTGKEESNEWTSNYPSSPWSPPRAVQVAATTVSRNDGHTKQYSEASTPATDKIFASTVVAWYDPAKSILAVIGLAAIGLKLVRLIK